VILEIVLVIAVWIVHYVVEIGNGREIKNISGKGTSKF
jgi:hypothetical protein